MNLLVVVIGVGSALYHGTLLYGMQMWDEIPMVWAMLAFHYFLYEYNTTPRDGSPITRALVILYALLVCDLCYATLPHVALTSLQRGRALSRRLYVCLPSALHPPHPIGHCARLLYVAGAQGDGV